MCLNVHVCGHDCACIMCATVHVHECLCACLCVLCVKVCISEYECMYAWAYTYTKACTSVHMCTYVSLVQVLQGPL